MGDFATTAVSVAISTKAKPRQSGLLRLGNIDLFRRGPSQNEACP